MNKLKLIALLITMLTFGQQAYSQAVNQFVGNTCKSNTRPKSTNANPVTVTQGANGMQEVTIKVQGDYTFIFTTSKNSEAKTIGGPVQGVRVGLGKNPSGAIVATATTNVQGEATFKNVKQGTYIFIDVPNDKMQSESVKQNKN